MRCLRWNRPLAGAFRRLAEISLANHKINIWIFLEAKFLQSPALRGFGETPKPTGQRLFQPDVISHHF
jgi:hypothetical protein